MFRPARDVSGWFSGLPSDVREFYLPVSDATRRRAPVHLVLAQRQPGAPTLLYLHGVRWNLTAHLRRIENLRSFGFSVVAIDYRGFGKSDGEMPSEEGVYDGRRRRVALAASRGAGRAKRFIYGHSLGTAVATDLAVEQGHAPTAWAG